MEPQHNDLHYCLDLVRRYDRGRFLCALHAAEPVRQRLFAGLALTLEFRQAVQQASEPMLGHIRLQWWQEALESLYSEQPQEQPVIRALHAIHQQHPIARSFLFSLVDAYKDMLDGKLPDNPESISGMPLLAALAVMTTEDCAALKKLAVAWGIVEYADLHMENEEGKERITQARQWFSQWQQDKAGIKKPDRKRLRAFLLWETVLRDRLKGVGKTGQRRNPYQPMLALKLLLHGLIR